MNLNYLTGPKRKRPQIPTFLHSNAIPVLNIILGQSDCLSFAPQTFTVAIEGIFLWSGSFLNERGRWEHKSPIRQVMGGELAGWVAQEADSEAEMGVRAAYEGMV